MAEEIAENFERAMKKGFIGTFILMLLEKEPCHGYKIGKAIEEQTLGVWEPSTSTLYTVLNNLDEQGLISVKEETESGRPRKIYELTRKGKETLAILIEKQVQMKESMETFFTTTLGIEQAHEFLKYSPFEMMFGTIQEKTVEEQIQLLELHKVLITKQMSEFKERIKKIDSIISNLRKKQNKE